MSSEGIVPRDELDGICWRVYPTFLVTSTPSFPPANSQATVQIYLSLVNIHIADTDMLGATYGKIGQHAHPENNLQQNSLAATSHTIVTSLTATHYKQTYN